MTIQEIIAAQRQILNAANAEGRALTEEEQARFNELQRKFDEAVASGQSSAAPQVTQTPPDHSGDRSGDSGEDPDATRSAAIQEERTRISSITAMCRNFGLDAQPFIDSGQSLDQVRATVIEQLQTAQQPIGARVGETGAEKRAAAASDALMMRAGITVEHPAEGADDFRGASLRSIAASCLAEEDSSKNYFMMEGDRLFNEVLSRSYLSPSAAFPAILDQTIQKSYVNGHNTAPVTFDRFVTFGTLSDFKKATNRYVAGSFGEFLEVPEGGELKHFVPKDEKLPQRQLKTYGRQFTMSRQAFIDDDIGLITRIPRQAAQAARRTQNSQVYKILVENGKIYDGKQLFSKDHRNLLKTGTGVTREAVQAMILALGGHRTAGVDGGAGDAILIRPRYIVVPLGYKFQMYTLFNSATIDNAGTVNPLLQYRDQIEVIEDATLNALVADKAAIPWFMIGDNADVDGIAVDYLNGKAIPNVRRMEVAGQLGFVWDFYLDWGISVQDYRAFVKNPGVVIESPLDLA